MPFAVSGGDRKLLISAGVVLGVLVVLTGLFTQPEPIPTVYPSSYSAASDGAKATFITLQELGYKIERWEDSPTELPKNPAGTVLILADPFGKATPEEELALSHFLLDGGRVLVTSFGARFLPENDAHTAHLKEYAWANFPAVMPSPLTRGAREITLLPWLKWGTRYAGHVPLYSDKDNAPVAVTYSIGKGRVIWLAASVPLTNAGVERRNNLEFLINVLGAPPGRILWDEYFHGHGKSLTDYIARTPVPWGLAQAGLVFLAALFAFSRRSGPVRPLVEPSRLSPLEFIDTLGGLYQSAHAAQAAVDVAYRRFRFIVMKRSGLAANASDEQIAAAAARAVGVPENAILETLQRCRAAAFDYEIKDDAAIEVVKKLHEYGAKLSVRNS
ncbi:MAG TPA: DUF4350 domain-containing protein [Terriglobales bacterium]|nr:DUF4350 domain-containing protein [Terriglobales bacterium]